MICRIAFTFPHGIKMEDTIAWKCFNRLPPSINDIVFQRYYAQGCSIGINRNLCISQGNDTVHKTQFPFDVILFVDFDTEFILQDIIKLITLNLPIVSGAYRRKEDPRKIVAGWWRDGVVGCNGRDVMCDQKGTLEVDWTGAGFLLIRSEALAMMDYPYFKPVTYKFTDDNGVEHSDMTTEDFGFNIEAVRVGFKNYVACDVLVKHHNHIDGLTQEPNSFFIKLNKEQIKFLRDKMQVMDLKGSDVTTWAGLHNALNEAHSSIG